MGFISSSHLDSPRPVSYSLFQIRQTAARALAEVSSATQQHDTTWRQIHDWLTDENQVDPAWADVILTCLVPYAQRLRASYDWLTDLASALFAAADFLEGTDQQMADSFQPTHGYAP
ncbi:MAG: hypothetical protein IRZ24_19585 [Thermogemmatispora sp.]|uniref:hypothetical protein n=1 Tax=Thermogemmatispora sp. TaxID=1968838 RepID=UPI001DAAD3AD|nr:hypothetical protein [Thermogemmatispora sp.]MBX5452275.1 hypothetical protein [Thermogemmatispora sp.]